jgi:hypothetical protein
MVKVKLHTMALLLSGYGSEFLLMFANVWQYETAKRNLKK